MSDGGRRLALDGDGAIPNNPRLPALVVSQVLAGAGAAECAARFAGHGWVGAWTDGIYPFHHFHSTAHEALGIVGGSARIALGGPGGVELEISAGDVLVLPAGTGHRNLSSTPDLLVVGAYDRGLAPDLLRGDPAQYAAAVARIASVPHPEVDPVAGAPYPRR